MFGPRGNNDHDECIRIIHRALDAGINFLDTADIYNQGRSEEFVGKALVGRRSQALIGTKASFRMLRRRALDADDLARAEDLRRSAAVSPERKAALERARASRPGAEAFAPRTRSARVPPGPRAQCSRSSPRRS